jgi:hypothetical protein
MILTIFEVACNMNTKELYTIKRNPVPYTVQKVPSNHSTLFRDLHDRDNLTFLETFFEKVDVETFALLYKFLET